MSDRRPDRENIAESAAVLRSVVEAAVDAIILIDDHGLVRSFNPGAERMFGYEADEVVGRNVNLLMPEPYHSEHDHYLERYLQTGERRIIGIGREVEGRRKDGTVFPLDLAVSEVPYGERRLFSGIARDLSPLRAAADALRRSDESMRLLVEGIADHAMLLLEPDGTVANWNAGAERMFGYTEAEMVGRTMQVMHPDDEDANELLRLAAVQGKIERRARRIRADGTEFDAHVIVAPVSAGDGSLRGFAKVINDITVQQAEAVKRQAIEAQLRQAQRLESVGQLAGGVAHDFNNLLSVVLGSVTLLESALGDVLDESQDSLQILADLRQIEEAARRGAALTRQLLTFSRRDVVAPQVLDLDEVIDNVSELLRRSIGEHIDLQVSNDGEERWRVLIDRGQFEQVLVNLAVNARDAMPNGGILTIEIANVVLDEAFLQPQARMAPGPYVQMAVSDSGVGMPPDVAARAFEPFFTTKPPGSGTGLGLATIYGIVTGAGGVVRIYSEAGYGTSVKVYLPATPVDGDAPLVLPDEHEPRAREATERVLLVEDELAVRDLARRLLEQAGYDVCVAANGPEALELFDEHGASIDLLLTDMIMPGISGRELAHRLRARRPGLRVLYMSGYTAGLLGPQAILEEGEELLEKPFTRAGLLARINHVLGHDAGVANDVEH